MRTENTPPPSPTDARLTGIDAGRYLAAAAVILLHAITSTVPRGVAPWSFVELATRFAVPFFFLAGGYFLPPATTPLPRALTRTFTRLVLPYLLWLLFYLALLGKLETLADPKRLIAVLATGGDAYHLWFLPALGLGMAATIILRRLLPPRALLLVAVLALAACLATSSYRETLGIPGAPGRGGWPMGLSMVLAGHLMRDRRIRAGLGPALAMVLAGYALTLIESALLHRATGSAFGAQDFLMGTAPLGVGAFLLARSPAANRLTGVARLGRISLGVYCIHVAVLLALLRLPPSPPTSLSVVVLAGATLLGSTLACLLLARVAALRRLIV